MYYLVSKIDRTDHSKVRKEPFATEDQAMAMACGLLATGEAFACVLEDDNGTVADDAEVVERCKGR